MLREMDRRSSLLVFTMQGNNTRDIIYTYIYVLTFLKNRLSYYDRRREELEHPRITNLVAWIVARIGLLTMEGQPQES